jgi:DNA-binding IscR family transcriptional regulator
VLTISESAITAIRAMVHLVVVKARRPLSSSRIAASLDVSKDQLSKVLQRLVEEGLLTSRRGPRGGARRKNKRGHAEKPRSARTSIIG